MTTLKLTLISILAVMITACETTKKSSTTSSNSTTSTTSSTLIPGTTQLTAIKTKFPDATADQLKLGYAIFTGPCTNCHKQYSIPKRSESSWLHEIDDMSPKANLTPEQKEALTRYVLSMKATQVAQ